jgi:hypothetical protein
MEAPNKRGSESSDAPASPARVSLSAKLSVPTGASPQRNANSETGVSAKQNSAGRGSTIYGSKWSCSACGMPLQAESVVQGSAVLVDGKLQCEKCVKAAGRRLQLEKSRARLLVTLALGTIGAIAVLGFFLPNQALVLALIAGICAVLIGAGGFTLGSNARLFAVAGGLVVITLASLGLVLSGKKEKEQVSQSEISMQVAQVKSMLEKDCVAEAEMRINVIESEANKKYSGEPAPAIKSAIADLRTLTAQWQQKHYGNLQPPEQKLLSELGHRLGSLTPYSQTRRVNSFKVEGTHLAIVVATDVKPPEFENSTDDGTTVNPDTDNPIKAEALRVCKISLKANPSLQTVDVKIISGDGKELFARSYDKDKVASIRKSMVPASVHVDPASKALLPTVNVGPQQ